jgi:hypothetical protein
MIPRILESIVKESSVTYSTVMVYVDAADAPERRLRLAAGVADKFNATLIGMPALEIRPAFVTDGAWVFGGMTRDLLATSRLCHVMSY